MFFIFLSETLLFFFPRSNSRLSGATHTPYRHPQVLPDQEFCTTNSLKSRRQPAASLPRVPNQVSRLGEEEAPLPLGDLRSDIRWELQSAGPTHGDETPAGSAVPTHRPSSRPPPEETPDRRPVARQAAVPVRTATGRSRERAPGVGSAPAPGPRSTSRGATAASSRLLRSPRARCPFNGSSGGRPPWARAVSSGRRSPNRPSPRARTPAVPPGLELPHSRGTPAAGTGITVLGSRRSPPQLYALLPPRPLPPSGRGSCRPAPRIQRRPPRSASPRLSSPHGVAGALRSPAQHRPGLSPSLREVSCHRSGRGKQKLQSWEREEEDGQRKRRSEGHCSPAAPLPSAADSSPKSSPLSAASPFASAAALLHRQRRGTA